MFFQQLVREALISLAVAAVQEFVAGPSHQSPAPRQPLQSCDLRRLEYLQSLHDLRRSDDLRSSREQRWLDY